MEFRHVPVMLEECMDGLALKTDGVYFDGTLGGAGHSSEILKRTSPGGKLIATDLDVEAIANAKERLPHITEDFNSFTPTSKIFPKL